MVIKTNIYKKINHNEIYKRKKLYEYNNYISYIFIIFIIPSKTIKSFLKYKFIISLIIIFLSSSYIDCDQRNLEEINPDENKITLIVKGSGEKKSF